jgi:hypothetical protein
VRRVKRSSVVLSVCAGLLLLATGFFLLYPSRGLPNDPLRAMPANIHGFVRVRPARVIASKPWREIVVDRKEDRGIQRVVKTCGFNPFESLSEIAVFALPNTKDTDVVVNARGSLTRLQLIDCAGKFSGGTLDSFVYERVAGFDTARSKKGTTRAAFVGRDGFIAGSTQGVSETLRSLAGESPNAESNPLLKELYASLSQDSEIALALRVPSDPKLRALLVNQLALLDSTLLEDVRALSLDVHLIDDRIRADLKLWAQDAERANALARTIEAMRERILALPGLGLLGIATPLRALQVEQNAAELKVHAEVRARTINAVIDLLPALAALQGMPAAQPPQKVEAREQNNDAGALP